MRGRKRRRDGESDTQTETETERAYHQAKEKKRDIQTGRERQTREGTVGHAERLK